MVHAALLHSHLPVLVWEHTVIHASVSLQSGRTNSSHQGTGDGIKCAARLKTLGEGYGPSGPCSGPPITWAGPHAHAASIISAAQGARPCRRQGSTEPRQHPVLALGGMSDAELLQLLNLPPLGECSHSPHSFGGSPGERFVPLAGPPFQPLPGAPFQTHHVTFERLDGAGWKGQFAVPRAHCRRSRWSPPARAAKFVPDWEAEFTMPSPPVCLPASACWPTIFLQQRCWQSGSMWRLGASSSSRTAPLSRLSSPATPLTHS